MLAAGAVFGLFLPNQTNVNRFFKWFEHINIGSDGNIFY